MTHINQKPDEFHSSGFFESCCAEFTHKQVGFKKTNALMRIEVFICRSGSFLDHASNPVDKD